MEKEEQLHLQLTLHNVSYYIAFSLFKFAVVLSEFCWCSSGIGDGVMTECENQWAVVQIS